MVSVDAVAQTIPAVPSSGSAGTAPPELITHFMQTVGTIHQTQQQARANMLGALTPTHRAAAAQLDAALYPSEVQAIGRAEAAMRNQMLGVVRQAQNDFQQTMPPEQRQRMEQDVQNGAARLGPAVAKAIHDENDAGQLLLRTALSGVQPFARLLDRTKLKTR